MVNSRAVARQLQIPKKQHGNYIQKPMSQQTLQQTVLAKQKTDSKTQQASEPIRILPSAKPATMEPAIAKGAGGKGEALRSVSYTHLTLPTILRV